MVEEEGETVPVGQETLDCFETRGREGVGVRILFRLALHKGEMFEEIGPFFDAIFGIFPESIEVSDSRDPGGDPGTHPRDGVKALVKSRRTWAQQKAKARPTIRKAAHL